MKKKQVIAISIACAIFIFTGIVGVAAAYFLREKEKEAATSVSESIGGILSDEGVSIDMPQGEFIGMINIKGTIMPDQESSGITIGGTQNEYNHGFIMKCIDEMEKAPNNKGILLNVDSPGGTVFETDELYLRLMEYKKNTERPVYAYFGNQACSGAYYISMASDYIVANRNCMIGSIGVMMSFMNYEKLYEKIGIEEIDIVSGKNKAMGSSGKEMTDEQREILQGLVDDSYDQFVEIVSQGRKLDEATVRKIGDGRIYTPKQSLENGMIDQIDDLEVAKSLCASAANCDNAVFFEPKFNQGINSIFSGILGEVKSFTSSNEIEELKKVLENKGSGVLMYVKQ